MSQPKREKKASNDKRNLCVLKLNLRLLLFCKWICWKLVVKVAASNNAFAFILSVDKDWIVEKSCVFVTIDLIESL